MRRTRRRFSSARVRRLRGGGARLPAHLATLLLIASCGCASAPAPGEPLARRGDEISVCGELFHTGTPVVLWNDPGGYDAYRVEPRFPEEMTAEELAAWEVKAHYHSLRLHLPEWTRRRVARRGWTARELAQHVDLFVIHYDACGASRRCFQVLHDRRCLSVHFLLDVDGTIYQTLDLKERAWHAAQANDRSVGVEIANIGAYPDANAANLTSWYALDACGPYVVFPERPGGTGVRTPLFVARPARAALISGSVQGATHYQYDFTEEQYAALAKLAAALHRVLPRIALDAPRDAAGNVRTGMLAPEELERFSGLVGHLHVTDQKVDPGPAFDWERVLCAARALVE
ncbi:MAG: N-acetylmuramoyl-L-alanine amidase [Planctomycetes bacterium]|nr:N-acetylmuramoyl-L-alanine amidase [Planctomycetota bacterium]